MRRALFIAPRHRDFLCLFVAPLTVLFVVSFWRKKLLTIKPDFTFKNYVSAFEKYGDVVLNTLSISAITAIVTTVLAFLFAYVIRFKAGRFGDLLLFITLVTLFGGYLRDLRVEDDPRQGRHPELGASLVRNHRSTDRGPHL